MDLFLTYILGKVLAYIVGMDESESEDSLYLTVVSETERVPVVLERVAQFARRQGICGLRRTPSRRSESFS